MASGVLVGFLFRRHRLRAIHPAITVLIWILLFLLGLEVGGNRHIVEGLFTLGIEAVVITVACVLGSVVVAWLLWLFIYNKRKK